jgi:hypothetical protein
MSKNQSDITLVQQYNLKATSQFNQMTASQEMVSPKIGYP